MMQADPRRSWILVGCLVLLTAGCGSPKIGLDATGMPDAALLGRADLEALEQGSFWNSLSDLLERHKDEEGLDPNMIPGSIPSVLKASGLALEDLLEVRVAMSSASQDDFPAVFGFRVSRPVTPEQFQDGFTLIGKKIGREVRCTVSDHPAGRVLSVEFEAGEGNRGTMYVGFAERGKVVFLGGPAGVVGAMDRTASGEPAEIPESLADLQRMIPEKTRAWLVYTVSSEQRDLMRESLSGEVPVPVLADLGKSLQSLQGYFLYADLTDSLELSMNWSFRDEGDAGRFLESMQKTVELLKGVLPLATGGKSLDVVDHLTVSVKEARVTLDLAVTEHDLQTFEELYELNFSE